MIELYYWTTPNGHKITIFLEESNIPYQIIPVNIGVGEQFQENFLKIAPNNRIPAIVDTDPKTADMPISVFESGAILVYLAEKIGQYLPATGYERYNTLQWLFWQMAGLGPMAGQNHHFAHYALEKIPYAVERYVKETARLYAVLNKQLSDKEYITGEYSIADMACYPWVALHDRQQQNMDDFPNLKRWHNAMKARPAVIRAYSLANDINPKSTMTPEAKKILFGQDAKTVR